MNNQAKINLVIKSTLNLSVAFLKMAAKPISIAINRKLIIFENLFDIMFIHGYKNKRQTKKNSLFTGIRIINIISELVSLNYLWCYAVNYYKRPIKLPTSALSI
jgi:hypothetical protein